MARGDDAAAVGVRLHDDHGRRQSGLDPIPRDEKRPLYLSVRWHFGDKTSSLGYVLGKGIVLKGEETSQTAAEDGDCSTAAGLQSAKVARSVDAPSQPADDCVPSLREASGQLLRRRRGGARRSTRPNYCCAPPVFCVKRAPEIQQRRRGLQVEQRSGILLVCQ